MRVSSFAMVEKDKMQTTKTPKGLGKKKEKSGVGVLWAAEPWALQEQGGAEGGRPLKVHLWPLPHLFPICQGGRTLISLLTSPTGSGEERGEVRVWAVTHTRNP